MIHSLALQHGLSFHYTGCARRAAPLYRRLDPPPGLHLEAGQALQRRKLYRNSQVEGGPQGGPHPGRERLRVAAIRRGLQQEAYLRERRAAVDLDAVLRDPVETTYYRL